MILKVTSNFPSMIKIKISDQKQLPWVKSYGHTGQSRSHFNSGGHKPSSNAPVDR